MPLFRMRMPATLGTVIWAQVAAACEAPVCLAHPDDLALSQIITFESTPAGHGPGHQFADILVLDGARFGERFAGQSVEADGDHDRITGQATPPLELLPGARGQNLSVVFMNGNRLLNGYGVAGYPRRHAQGEGAIAFLFDTDQAALAFEVRGGEGGAVRVLFLRRDASVIAEIDLTPAGERPYGFLRGDGSADIAGVVVTNTDAQGIGFDNLRFGRPPGLS
jgi:hypothetical protein